eukprot:757038-Rhodomonas_salina.3
MSLNPPLNPPKSMLSCPLSHLCTYSRTTAASRISVQALVLRAARNQSDLWSSRKAFDCGRQKEYLEELVAELARRGENDGTWPLGAALHAARDLSGRVKSQLRGESGRGEEGGRGERAEL